MQSTKSRPVIVFGLISTFDKTIHLFLLFTSQRYKWHPDMQRNLFPSSSAKHLLTYRSLTTTDFVSSNNFLSWSREAGHPTNKKEASRHPQHKRCFWFFTGHHQNSMHIYGNRSLFLFGRAIKGRCVIILSVYRKHMAGIIRATLCNYHQHMRPFKTQTPWAGKAISRG